MRSIGVISPLLWLDNKKSVSVLVLSSRGFVHLELGVFIKASETNKTHLNVKAPEETVNTPGGREHFAEKRVLWDILARQLGWAVTGREVAPGVRATALNRGLKSLGICSAVVGGLGCYCPSGPPARCRLTHRAVVRSRCASEILLVLSFAQGT